METSTEEDFFKQYNIDSKEHDVLKYWISLSATNEIYKRLTLFLIQNDVFVDMIDAFVKLISYDADNNLIEYVLERIEKNLNSSLPPETYQTLIYTCIRKHKLEYIEKIQKTFSFVEGRAPPALDKHMVLSNYFGNGGAADIYPFHFFVVNILNSTGSNGRLQCEILKENVTENDKKIFKLVYSNNMEDVEHKIKFMYETNRRLTEGIIVHLCKMYDICANNVLTREARAWKMQWGRN